MPTSSCPRFALVSDSILPALVCEMFGLSSDLIQAFVMCVYIK